MSGFGLYARRPGLTAGGKGGTRTLDPGIMSGRSKSEPVISITCRGAPVAISTTKHDQAALSPAKVPQGIARPPQHLFAAGITGTRLTAGAHTELVVY